MPVDVDYALRGEVSVAFQSIGDGPVDLILGCGLASHLDLLWSDPSCTAFLRSLGSMGRLLLFDKPGTGLSDPVVGPPTLDERVDDFLAVLDAAGSRRAIVIGFSEAAAPAALLAATHPDRVEALVMLSGAPRFKAGPDYLVDNEPYLEDVVWSQLWHSADHWGDGTFLTFISPQFRRSGLYRRLAPGVERASASPGMARSLIRGVRSYDVTGVLGAVRVPTLVVHRSDEVIPVSAARYSADHIPGARLAVLPGDEHFPYFHGDDIIEEIGRFVGGSKRAAVTERKLATVLFTDIVGSTALAAELGDEHWASLLDHHDDIARDKVERYDGRVVKSLGDGLFAVFDRPLLAIRCALAIRDACADVGLEIRAGIHTGECDLVHDDLAGIAVHIGARIAALADAGEVFVSSSVRDLVLGSGVEFATRGEHDLRGVPGKWVVHSVVDDRSKAQRPAHQASPEEAALTPAPAAAMRPTDRALVGFAARVPALMRGGARVVNGVESGRRKRRGRRRVSETHDSREARQPR